MTRDEALVTAFIRQGFVSYPAALEAVEYFEAEMYRTIRRAFDEKKDWTKIRRAIGADAQLLPPKEGRTSGAARWLWSYVECEKRGEDKSWLTLGVCWNPPKQPSGAVVAYANYAIGSKFIHVADRPGRDGKIKIGSLDRGERRPFIVVDEHFNAEEDFRLLVDYIDVAIP
jgi:hypothetical protein